MKNGNRKADLLWAAFGGALIGSFVMGVIFFGFLVLMPALKSTVSYGAPIEIVGIIISAVSVFAVIWAGQAVYRQLELLRSDSRDNKLLRMSEVIKSASEFRNFEIAAPPGSFTEDGPEFSKEEVLTLTMQLQKVRIDLRLVSYAMSSLHRSVAVDVYKISDEIGTFIADLQSQSGMDWSAKKAGVESRSDGPGHFELVSDCQGADILMKTEAWEKRYNIALDKFGTDSFD
ncbi:hypothetical protein [Cohaesibacter marisflavi]|uniref:hypothetical protein n=1 Tax=Cohaesibacter marisflavi TaxID=655353 RepID=UPI000B7C9338|nr:hypothetical protein [Cohaesibacter marisflavi]